MSKILGIVWLLLLVSDVSARNAFAIAPRSLPTPETFAQPSSQWVATQPRALSEAERVKRLQQLSGWTIDNDRLICTLKFQNFVQSVQFVDRLVAPAEAVAHHPDITIAYNRVTLSLTTHDAGGLSDLDFDLANTISQLPEFPGCVSQIAH